MTELTKLNFKTEVEDYEGLVVIDLWATWCGPCLMLAPVIDEIEQEMPEVKFCKINVDDERELAMEFKIQSIPTIAIVKNNTFLDLSVGLVPKEKLVNLIKRYL